MDPIAREDQFGKFVRSEKLGAGGMGEVWKAYDSKLGRPVALKLLKSGDDGEIARFKREAQLAGKLAHPNIAAIYEVGEARGRHFIAMQFIDGPTLRNAKLPRRECVEKIRDAALAVAYAHDQGIIHRDLKPDNLMVAGGRVYILDFGLARAVDGARSLSGVIAGTPAFMAPEQARGERVDERADVYSLGATLYMLITGRPPHRGATPIKTLELVIKADPAAPRAIDPTVDRDLERVVLKCLEKDRARRYPDPGELAKDLDRWLRGEPVTARPRSLGSRARAWATRHRAIVAVATTAIAAMAAVAFIVLPGMKAGTREQAAAAERARLDTIRRQEVMQELLRLWNRAVTIKEWTRQEFRKAADIRAGFEACADQLSRFIALHPDLAQAHYLRAKIRLHLHDRAEAQEDLDRATALQPDFGLAWTLKGMVLAEKFWWDQMTRLIDVELEGAGPIVAEIAEALRRGRIAGSAPQKWGLSRTADDDVADTVSDALVAYYAEGRKDEAIHRLYEALKVNPAQDYFRWLGAWATSLELMDSAIAVAPFEPQFYLQRGSCRRHKEQWDGAIADFTRAIELDPSNCAAYSNRGLSFKKLGRLREAMEDYDRAIALEPDAIQPRINRGLLHIDLGNPDRALADGDHILAQKPRHPETVAKGHAIRGGALLRKGDMGGAIAALGRSIEADPRVKGTYVERSFALRAMREYHKALNDCNAALAIDPRFVEGLAARGDVKRGLGLPDDAFEDYTTAIGLRPSAAELWLKRAVARCDRGEYPAAIADATQALDLSLPGTVVRTECESILRQLKERTSR